MSSYCELQKLAENPAAVVSLAAVLLALTDAGWSEWEAKFETVGWDAATWKWATRRSSMT